MKRNLVLYLGLPKNIKWESTHKPQPDFSRYRFLFSDFSQFKTSPVLSLTSPQENPPQPPYYKNYLFFPPLPIVFLFFISPLWFPFPLTTCCFKQEASPATDNPVCLFTHPFHPEEPGGNQTKKHSTLFNMRMEGGRWEKLGTLTYFKKFLSDFPGSPVVETPSFQCKEHRFHPQLGN